MSIPQTLDILPPYPESDKNKESCDFLIVCGEHIITSVNEDECLNTVVQIWSAMISSYNVDSAMLAPVRQLNN
ncbi:hypothetical protein JAB1_49880 [Janthinobacterium sp. MP5059B]|nr:hypothetical protein JAB1_49880 [Janthinobacterium sp. MP5059B]